MAERAREAAYRWTEEVLGGKIVDEYAQERWRPQWFLTVEKPSGERKKVVLRGFRNPGYASPDEAHARHVLKIDAEMLAALQDIPVKTAEYFGFNEDLGWMLMEWVDGESEITDLADSGQRHAIFREYVEDLAILHSQPLEKMKIPSGLWRPGSVKEYVDVSLAQTAKTFAEAPRPDPEPIFRFGYQWLVDNPLGDRPLKLGLLDVGPNQFLFKDGHYKALFDCEFAIVADPLLDIALMRSREMTYPIGGVTDHIRHYGTCYEKLTGDSLDEKALHYWTIFGQTVFQMYFNHGLQFPSAIDVDTIFLYSWEAQNRRALPEALADLYGLALEQPDLPEPMPNSMSTLHGLMIRQFDEHYAKVAANAHQRLFARYSKALAETLARSNDFGQRIHRDNMDELSELLGYRPDDWRKGLAKLEEMIERDYQKDFEKRIRFFHRFVIRQEYLYEPMQTLTGVASRAPLSRLNA